MRLSAEKELKIAIKALPEKEKDKLLLRLIAKDKILTEHLHFKLMEGEEDLLSRQELLMADINQSIAGISGRGSANARDILVTLRKLMAATNRHFKITKDLNTTLELKLHLLNSFPMVTKAGFFKSPGSSTEKLHSYFLKSVKSLQTSYDKLHEDLQFDYRPALDSLLQKVESYS